MVDLIQNISALQNSSLVSTVLNKLIELPGVSNLVKIFQAVGIVLLIYFIFLIIRTITQIRHNIHIKAITKNVEDINKKMDVLIDKKNKKQDKNKK